MTLPIKGLPDFPWDTIAGARAAAQAHPDGIVDLSVGTPVDPTPLVIQQALQQAADAHGYPQVWGTPDLREAVAAWFARRRNAPGVDPDGVMPTIGSKELVAWLPTMLGLGPGDVVGFPQVAYPTYDVGARLAGATPAPAASLLQYGPTAPKLLWLNTPGNPTGKVLGLDHLRKVVDWARDRGVIVASDECYAELDWRESPEGLTAPSLLDERVCRGDHRGLLVAYSCSKQSNMAGYRAAFVAGDPQLVRGLVEVGRHSGMMMPWPVQRAMVAALADDEHVAVQKQIYARRRTVLSEALTAAGWRIEDSEAGLYLWVTRGRPARQDLDDFAALGILAAPGDFYGAAGAQFCRIALTAPDERIDSAASRLVSAPRP